jgi:hypothetical protein
VKTVNCNLVFYKIPIKTKYGEIHLQFQPLGRQKYEDPSPRPPEAKKLAKPYLNHWPSGQVQWLTPVIPDTWDVEMGNTIVGGQ